MNEPETGSQSGDEPRPLSDLGKENVRRPGDAPDSQPRALPYESPMDRSKREAPLNVLGMTFAMAIGFAIAAAFVLFFSGMIYVGVNNDFMSHHAPSTDHRALRYCAAVFFVLFVAVFLGVVRLAQVPGWRQVGRWWILGMLLGAGAGMLVEGICFAAT